MGTMPGMSCVALGMDMSTTGSDAEHNHPARMVDDDLPVSALSHLLSPDVMDGANVQILPRNFSFTPAAITEQS